MVHKSIYHSRLSPVIQIFIICLTVTFSCKTASAQGTITGNIVYASDALTPIHDSTLVRLYQGTLLIREIPVNPDGSFTFDSVPDGTYKINASVNKVSGGWNAKDSYLIERYEVGYLPTLTGLYYFAGDVNASGGTPGAIDALCCSRLFTYHIQFDPGWISQMISVTVASETSQSILVQVICRGDVDGSFIPY